MRQPLINILLKNEKICTRDDQTKTLKKAKGKQK